MAGLETQVSYSGAAYRGDSIFDSLSTPRWVCAKLELNVRSPHESSAAERLAQADVEHGSGLIVAVIDGCDTAGAAGARIGIDRLAQTAPRDVGQFQAQVEIGPGPPLDEWVDPGLQLGRFDQVEAIVGLTLGPERVKPIGDLPVRDVVAEVNAPADRMEA
jgi:hypothetical protein